MTRLLPKIETQIAFRRFAKARGLEASTYEDACRHGFDSWQAAYDALVAREEV